MWAHSLSYVALFTWCVCKTVMNNSPFSHDSWWLQPPVWGVLHHWVKSVLTDGYKNHLNIHSEVQGLGPQRSLLLVPSSCWDLLRDLASRPRSTASRPNKTFIFHCLEQRSILECNYLEQIRSLVLEPWGTEKIMENRRGKIVQDSPRLCKVTPYRRLVRFW